MSSRPVSQVIATKSHVTVPPNLSVRDAARMMKVHHEGSVLVIDKDRLIGICTERDLAFDVIAEGLDPDTTMVGDVMTANPQTISPEKPFCHALHMMYEGGFRHVPVVDKSGRAVGVVCARDAINVDALELSQDLIHREEISVIL
jgi:CBS domain-containing protein